MKKLLALILLTASAAFAQNPATPVVGQITAATTNATCAGGVQNGGAVDQAVNTATGAVGVSVTGTWVATLNIQFSVDHGKTWTASGGTFTSNQQSIITSAGTSDICVFASAYTSGTAVVTFATSAVSSGGGASTITGNVTVVQPTGSNLQTQTQGTAAADTAASGNPVQIGGVDAAGNIQELPVADDSTAAPAQTVLIGGLDTNSGFVRQLRVFNGVAVTQIGFGTPADGIANVGSFLGPPTSAGTTGPALAGTILFNGTSWDRAFYCNLTKFVAGVTATTTQIVAASAGTKIRVCSVTIERNDTTGVATTLKLVEGTGANCAAGQTSLTGNLFSSGATAVTTDSPPVAITLGASGPFITNTVADALCVQTTGAASSFDVTITEAQY